MGGRWRTHFDGMKGAWGKKSNLLVGGGAGFCGRSLTTDQDGGEKAKGQ